MTGTTTSCPPPAHFRGSWRGTVKRAVLRAASVVSRLDRRAGHSALLTFDDGPHPEVTTAVLDRLERYDAHAVFFIVGNRIPLAPWALSRILDGGHRLGNHTYYHDYKNRGVSEYSDDIGRCQGAVEALIGVSPSLFRPPLGRITVSGLRAARRHGLKTYHWSVECADWSLRSREAAIDSGERLGRIIGPGDIVLLHDDNPYVLPILDVLLPQLADRGLDLRPPLEGP